MTIWCQVKFGLKTLRRADVVGSSGQGSDENVFGGGWCRGVVADIRVGVSGFPVDRGRFVRVDEDVYEGVVAVRGDR